ncbi:MAG: glutamyl-tRNA reductase [Chloroflexota bacterium]|nr:glutamyl-tRNA reductase [Chloroflexota bacterium]MDE2959056.1 glutamyl-tRNA reductase [Chloroflexota bacterium]
MSLLVLGLDHRTAPVELRERLSVERDQLPDALEQLAEYVPQSVIVSTCNRTEVYTYDPDDIGLVGRVGDFLIGYSGVPGPELERHIYQLWESDCVSHLFRVASGLESMIVGERQILGQVRAAFSVASQGGYLKSPLTRVFHDALRAGRRVHRETNIGQHSRSVSRAAVQLARGLFDRLDDRRALVIGAGDAGRMVARALADAGVQQITVVNRTHWRAQDLARDLGGVAIPFENLGDALADADLVISSTGSPGYVVDEAMVAEALTRRRGDEPMMLIDIAVPRDIEPTVGDLDRARLFDIDALAQVAEVSMDGLAGEVKKASALVDAELTRFSEWWHSSDTMELVVGLRRRADTVRREEVARTLRMLGEDEESELAERLHAMTNALVKKLLHQPTVELRSGDNTTDYRVALRLFGNGDERRSRR